MQFLGQLHDSDSTDVLSIFMCQNDPGMCDEWDANAGGNAVVLISCDAPKLAQTPSSGECLRPVRYGGAVVEVEAESYQDACRAWRDQTGKDRAEVLGQLGGVPDWIQYDETPTCDVCGKPMAFVAQLEQGPDFRTSMNFGGGWAYVFDCKCASKSAKMVWQR